MWGEGYKIWLAVGLLLGEGAYIMAKAALLGEELAAVDVNLSCSVCGVQLICALCVSADAFHVSALSLCVRACCVVSSVCASHLLKEFKSGLLLSCCCSADGHEMKHRCCCPQLRL